MGIYHLSAASEAAIDNLDMVLVTISAQVQGGCGTSAAHFIQSSVRDTVGITRPRASVLLIGNMTI